MNLNRTPLHGLMLILLVALMMSACGTVKAQDTGKENEVDRAKMLVEELQVLTEQMQALRQRIDVMRLNIENDATLKKSDDIRNALNSLNKTYTFPTPRSEIHINRAVTAQELVVQRARQKAELVAREADIRMLMQKIKSDTSLSDKLREEKYSLLLGEIDQLRREEALINTKSVAVVTLDPISSEFIASSNTYSTARANLAVATLDNTLSAYTVELATTPDIFFQDPEGTRVLWQFAVDGTGYFSVNSEIAQLEQESTELGQQLQQAQTDEQRQDLELNLRKVLERIFDMKQEGHRKSLEDVQRKHLEMEERVNNREANRNGILERRYRQLTGQPDEYDW